MFSIPTSDLGNEQEVSSGEINIGGEQHKQQAPVSKTINLQDIDDPKTDKVKIDFFNDPQADPNGFIGQPTEPSKDFINPVGVKSDPSAPNFINTPTIGGMVSGKTKDDFRSSAKLIVTIIDAVLSNLLKFLAKSESSKQFSLAAEQTKMLTEAWVEFLFEKQQKMSPSFALALAMLSVYAFMIPEAIKSRQEHNKKFGNLPKKPILPQKPIEPIRTDNIQQQTAVPNTNNGENLPVVSGTISKSDKNPLGYAVGKHWTNPDPDIICETRSELQAYLDRGVFPMYVRNKVNKKIKRIDYNDNGEPKIAGRPASPKV